LSSLKGRDWSCFKNIVSMTPLSAVGAAFSAGAVCAPTPELNAKTPAIATAAISDFVISALVINALAGSDPILAPIAISLFGSVTVQDYCGRESPPSTTGVDAGQRL
jgi:hypothetical protein